MISIRTLSKWFGDKQVLHDCSLEVAKGEIVEEALSAYEKGKTLCIPGTINRAQTLVAKLLPRPLLSWGAVKAAERMGRR